MMLKTAIIGAGPYGLSIAAHLRHQAIPFRIFGRPMESWLEHMPNGMMLKSDGFALDIFDPDRDFTLRYFCAERGINYADTSVPVGLDTFAAYGLAFKERMVPEVEERLVVGLDRLQDGFRLRLDDGEIVRARRVVLAIGITHFGYIPPELSHLGSDFLSHSVQHHDLARFKGRTVVVVGGGASALDLAALLHDVKAEVQLVVRQSSLKFDRRPALGKRSLRARIWHAQSGLGPGLRARFFAEGAAAFHCLPERLRLHLVQTALGPSGGWFLREKVIGKVPVLLGQRPERAEIKNGRVHLHLRQGDGAQHEVVAEHVIAATGYRVDLERLSFIGREIRSKVKTVNGTPVLSPTFESSVPGLYFVGVAAAHSFGPVMRFTFGARFAARSLTRALLKLLPADSKSVPVVSVSAVESHQSRAVQS